MPIINGGEQAPIKDAEMSVIHVRGPVAGQLGLQEGGLILGLPAEPGYSNHDPPLYYHVFTFTINGFLKTPGCCSL